MRMPFGKHRGEDLSDVPTRYLKWVLENVDDLDDDLRDAVESEVDSRKPRRSTQSAPNPPPRYLFPPSSVKREHLKELVSAGRKALARKNHPDMGGDLIVMQAVNTAADWLEKLLDNVAPGGAQ